MTILSPNLRKLLLFLAPALLLAAGCGSGLVTAKSASSAFSVTPYTSSIDTNCTGCNATSAQGTPVHQFAATLAGGGAAEVTWSVQGGDATSGPGSINAKGQYTPPSYLTADRAEVVVTATLNANPSLRTSSVVTVTPGFLQPLTPENAALGANGSLTVTGFLAEAGGSTGINFKLASSPAGESGGQGSLSPVSCQRGSQSFTTCTVIYTAPASVQATDPTYVVATVGGASASSRAASVVLVNAAGVTSNPATHQAQFPASVALGSSGGNNADYDTRGEQIVDCCSGTLGALVEDASKRQYLLSNNHVLARSDHAGVGDAIVQPGLIDNNCSPLGDSGGVQPVASLTGWLPLASKLTDADAAIAQVTSRAVDPSGRILELGGKQADGTLAAAAPGISSTGGKGEVGTLDLKVAKSGRTTGLTCGGISAVDLDVRVDYYLDCAETRPYLTKTFTHQLGLSGNQFSDAGDSGALVVDAANAEPVGLYFAGGTDVSGVSEGVASPAPEVLNELGAQLGGGSYTFVGAADHAVSCLSYGDNTSGLGAKSPAERRRVRARPAGTGPGPHVCELLGRHSGRGRRQEQRPPRRRRRDSLHRREQNGERPSHAGRRAHCGDSHHGQGGGLRLGSADAARCGLRLPARIGAGAGRGRQEPSGSRSDAPESGLLRRGRGPEPGQPARGGADRLRGSQSPARATASDHRRPAHPLHSDGPAACDPFLRGSIAVEDTLHGAHAGNKPPAHRDKTAMNGAPLLNAHNNSSGLMSGPPALS